MKRIISVFLAILLLSSSAVFAQDTQQGEQLCFATVSPFPVTNPRSLIHTFSNAQTIEDVLVAGWETFSNKIDISSFNLTVEQFLAEYSYAFYANPRLYYVSTAIQYGLDPTTNLVTSVLPQYYTTDSEEISKTLAEIDKETDEILLLLSDEMSDFEKVMTVQNYMVFDYEYDYEDYVGEYKENPPEYSLLIMIKKTGVCQAYTLAFKYVMDKLAIPCIFVKSDPMVHGWNLVNIDGSWYHLDVTWNDTYTDDYAGMCNKFAILSDSKIQSLPSPHYSYDTIGLAANSTLYDDAPWRDSYGQVVSAGGKTYYASASENKIVCEDGEVIHTDDGIWDIGSSSWYMFRSGLAEHNGLLYYNTDKEIYSYNPETKEKKLIHKGSDICGIFIDKNTLNYSKGRMDSSSGSNILVCEKGGSILLDDTRFGEPLYESGDIVVRVYKEESEPLCIYSFGKKAGMEKITAQGLSKAVFDAENEQSIFFWNEKMQPLTKKKQFTK